MFLSHRNLAAIGRRFVWAGAVLAATVLASQSGCVERRMTIRSNPPGALVYVDDYEIGITPVSTDFIYYGSRKIRLVKDGFETLTVMQPIPTPWYQFPPFDFITENFVPGKIRDQHAIDFQLKPQLVVPTDQLLARAEGLRQNNMAGMAGTPIPQPGGLAPNSPPGAVNVLPGTIPATQPNGNSYLPPNVNTPPNTYLQPNTYPQPNTSTPPAASTQSNTYLQPNILTPPSLNPTEDIGGQGVHQLPPR
jgi:hypothetical protein